MNRYSNVVMVRALSNIERRVKCIKTELNGNRWKERWRIGGKEGGRGGKESRIKGVIQNRGFRYDRGREVRERERRGGIGRGLGGGR